MLQVNSYRKEGALLDIGAWTVEHDGKWRRCGRCLTDRQRGHTAKDFAVTLDIALGAYAQRGRNDPVTLQYAQLLSWHPDTEESVEYDEQG